eukprot:SM000016S01845  [mRNA]  locus=s16:243547:249791:+ [translate_table: standard]
MLTYFKPLQQGESDGRLQAAATLPVQHKKRKKHVSNTEKCQEATEGQAPRRALPTTHNLRTEARLGAEEDARLSAGKAPHPFFQPQPEKFEKSTATIDLIALEAVDLPQPPQVEGRQLLEPSSPLHVTQLIDKGEGNEVAWPKNQLHYDCKGDIAREDGGLQVEQVSYEQLLLVSPDTRVFKESVGTEEASPTTSYLSYTDEIRRFCSAVLQAGEAPDNILLEPCQAAVHPTEDASSSPLYSNMLWTERHRPLFLDKMCGNKDELQALRRWLSDWKERIQAISRSQDIKRAAQGEHTRSCIASDVVDTTANDCQLDDDSGLQNPLLLRGPVGVGKTAAVYVCAREVGFNILEVNASDQRSSSYLKSRIGEALASHGLRHWSSEEKEEEQKQETGLHTKVQKPKEREGRRGWEQLRWSSAPKTPVVLPGSRTCADPYECPLPVCHAGQEETIGKEASRMSVILFEDVDSVVDEDRGFLAAVTDLVVTTKRPIILISNMNACLYDESLDEAQLTLAASKPDLPKALTTFCINFDCPSADEIVSYLTQICLAEELHVPLAILQGLVKSCHKDIRRLLLSLQYWGQGSKGADTRNVQAPIKSGGNGQSLTRLQQDIRQETCKTSNVMLASRQGVTDQVQDLSGGPCQVPGAKLQADEKDGQATAAVHASHHDVGSCDEVDTMIELGCESSCHGGCAREKHGKQILQEDREVAMGTSACCSEPAETSLEVLPVRQQDKEQRLPCWPLQMDRLLEQDAAFQLMPVLIQGSSDESLNYIVEKLEGAVKVVGNASEALAAQSTIQELARQRQVLDRHAQEKRAIQRAKAGDKAAARAAEKVAKKLAADRARAARLARLADSKDDWLAGGACTASECVAGSVALTESCEFATDQSSEACAQEPAKGGDEPSQNMQTASRTSLKQPQCSPEIDDSVATERSLEESLDEHGAVITSGSSEGSLAAVEEQRLRKQLGCVQEVWDDFRNGRTNVDRLCPGVIEGAARDDHLSYLTNLMSSADILRAPSTAAVLEGISPVEPCTSSLSSVCSNRSTSCADFESATQAASCLAYGILKYVMAEEVVTDEVTLHSLSPEALLTCTDEEASLGRLIASGSVNPRLQAAVSQGPSPDSVLEIARKKKASMMQEWLPQKVIERVTKASLHEYVGYLAGIAHLTLEHRLGSNSRHSDRSQGLRACATKLGMTEHGFCQLLHSMKTR